MADETINVRVTRLQGSLIEAKSGNHRVVIDAETGETVTTNVPIGGLIWRRLARVAHGYAPKG